MANKKDEAANAKGQAQRAETKSAKPPDQGRQAAESVAEEGRSTAQAGARAGSQAAEAAQQGMEAAAETGRQQTDQLRVLAAESTKAYEDVAEYSKDDVDAIMQSGARLAKGMQEMSWEMMNYTQQSLRMGLRAANDMMECRSVEDLVAVQRDFVKETVDVFLSESAKLLQLSSRVANDAVSPINERVSDSGRQPSRGRQASQRQSQEQRGRESGGQGQFREQRSAGNRELRH